MKILDWLWKICNKRQPKPYESYMQAVGMWFYIGLICGASLAIYLVLRQANEPSWFIPLVVMVVVSVPLGLATILQHKKDGYYDAIDKAGKRYWHKRAVKLGMITTKGKDE